MEKKDRLPFYPYPKRRCSVIGAACTSNPYLLVDAFCESLLAGLLHFTIHRIYIFLHLMLLRKSGS
jgi:hypothetical protein